MIFRGGSGSGINLSKIRGSKEQLQRAAPPPARCRSCAEPTPGPARSRRAARRGARPRWSCSTSTTRTSSDFIWCKAKEEDKAAALRDAGFDMSIDGEGFHSIQYQNANNSVRVTDDFMTAVERDEKWHTTARVIRPAGRHLRRGRPDAARSPRRPGAAPTQGSVRHHDQRLAHVLQHGADQRLQPLLRIHARRRLGLQPRLAQPDEVHARGRQLRRRGLRARRRHRLPGPGDPGRLLELPDRADRHATRARCASSASATRTSARC